MVKLNKPGANPAQESRLNHLPARLLQLNPPGISDLTPPPLHLDACPAINRWSPETALAIPIHAVVIKRPSVAMGVSAEGFDGLGEFVVAESLLALQASLVCAACGDGAGSWVMAGRNGCFTAVLWVSRGQASPRIWQRQRRSWYGFPSLAHSVLAFMSNQFGSI